MFHVYGQAIEKKKEESRLDIYGQQLQQIKFIFKSYLTSSRVIRIISNQFLFDSCQNQINCIKMFQHSQSKKRYLREIIK